MIKPDLGIWKSIMYSAFHTGTHYIPATETANSSRRIICLKPCSRVGRGVNRVAQRRQQRELCRAVYSRLEFT